MITNCPQCRKPFVRRNNRLCPDCTLAEYEEYQKVNDYLRIKPASTLDVVAEATGIPHEKILKMIQSGKINLRRPKDNVVMCKRCQRVMTEAEIILFDKTGKQFCVTCSEKLAENLRGTDKVAPAPLPLPKQIAPSEGGSERKYGLGRN